MPARPRTAAASKAASKTAPPAPAKTAAKPKRPTKAAAAGAAAVADAAATIVGAKPAAAPAVGAELRELPLAVVVPSPDNPRTVLEDLDSLARSIQLRGVLEPIVVVARADGDGYDLIMGHRRHAAATLAGLKTIPAVVRPAATADVDREALIDRMVENLQRHDLAVVDEARGYARLKSLGLTQDAISKAVGRNAGHVSKYLKLLSLPEPLQARVGASDGISIEAAVDVARLPGEVQVAIAEATHAGDDKRWTPVTFESTVRSLAARARRDASRAEAIARARKSKTVLLNVDGDDVGAQPRYDRAAGPAPLSWIHPRHVDGWEKAWTAHAKLPCHAAVVRAHPDAGDDAVRQWIEFVCTDPASHTLAADAPSAAAGDSPTRVPSPRGVGAAIAAPVDPEAEAHREAAAAAMTARRLFVATLLAGKLPAGATSHVVGGQLRDELLGAYYDDAPDLAIAADLLGLGASGEMTLEEVLRAAAGAAVLSGDQLLRWALAVRLASEEAAATSLFGFRPGMRAHCSVAERVVVKGYVEFLEAAGHELHPLERDVLFDDVTFEAALVDMGLLDEPEPEAVVDWAAVQREAGVTEEALSAAVVAGVPYSTWLRPGVKSPTGRCRACGGDAKALSGGRAGKHKVDGLVCSGGGQQLLSVAEVRDAEPAGDGVDEVTCPACEGVGRVGDTTDLCPGCKGRGLVAPAPVAAAG